jgi:hypothetical protein
MSDFDFLKVIRPAASLGLIEYRVIRSDGSSCITRFWSDVLPHRFESDRHYYFSPTLRPFKSSRVLGGWVLWLDVDASELPEFGEFPQPSIIVSSGRGHHVYWALRDCASPSQLKAWLPILARKFGGDLASAVETQLLRVPGSINPKWGKRCEIVSINGNRYTRLDLGLPDVVRDMPDVRLPAEREKKRDTSGFPISKANEFLLQGGKISDFIARFTGQPVARQMRCTLHEDVKPSLTVSDEKGFWFCHSCRVGGDAFEYYARARRLGHSAALSELRAAWKATGQGDKAQ